MACGVAAIEAHVSRKLRAVLPRLLPKQLGDALAQCGGASDAFSLDVDVDIGGVHLAALDASLSTPEALSVLGLESAEQQDAVDSIISVAGLAGTIKNVNALLRYYATYSNGAYWKEIERLWVAAGVSPRLWQRLDSMMAVPFSFHAVVSSLRTDVALRRALACAADILAEAMNAASLREQKRRGKMGKDAPPEAVAPQSKRGSAGPSRLLGNGKAEESRAQRSCGRGRGRGRGRREQRGRGGGSRREGGTRRARRRRGRDGGRRFPEKPCHNSQKKRGSADRAWSSRDESRTAGKRLGKRCPE